jgi:AcrR family transcriptional regulator
MAEDLRQGTRGATGDEGRDGDTRLRILDAAIACFTRYGNEKTTLNDVARVAGLARQTIYRHFPDRAAVLEAVRDLEDQRLRDDVAVLAGRAGTLEDFLTALVEARSRTANRYHTRQHLLERDLGLVTSLHLSRDHRVALLRELIAPVLEAARRRGELRPDVDTVAASEWIAIALSTVTTLTGATAFDVENSADVGRFYARHLCRGLVVSPVVEAHARATGGTSGPPMGLRSPR